MRYAVPVDLVSVSAVVHAAYRHYIERMGARPRPMDVDYTHLMRRGCLYVLGSPAVATVTLVPDDIALHLENLAVAPDRQGQGLGRRLLVFAEEHARRLWLPEIRLFTHATMWENQQMYRAVGYEEFARTPAKTGVERIHYRKPVDGYDPAALRCLPAAGAMAASGATLSAAFAAGAVGIGRRAPVYP